MNDSAAVLGTVHTIEKCNTTGSAKPCGNPVCNVEFNPTCLPWFSQSYCSDGCRQQASIIRRAVKMIAEHPRAKIPELDSFVMRRAKVLVNDLGLGEFHRALDRVAQDEARDLR